MAEFESWKQYSEFSDFVMRTGRHVRDAKNQRFLDTVVQTSEKRKRLIGKGAVLWRAQLDPKVRKILPPKRMFPMRDRANEGRVNPKGIPCLYCSTNRDTAMTETRPWIGACVTVARVLTIKDLTIVDCSAMDDLAEWQVDLLFGAPEPEAAKREVCVWGDINQAFSVPVAHTDDAADYAPTQVLAEAFRMSGCDGIVYGSKVGTGKTVAVFDPAAAKLGARYLFSVNGFEARFSAIPQDGTGVTIDISKRDWGF
jgi:RES domain-containing protein